MHHPYLYHTAIVFFLTVISLGLGFLLFAASKSLPPRYKKASRALGVFIMILATLGFIVSGSHLIGSLIRDDSKCIHHLKHPTHHPVKPEDWEKHSVEPPPDYPVNP